MGLPASWAGRVTLGMSCKLYLQYPELDDAEACQVRHFSLVELDSVLRQLSCQHGVPGRRVTAHEAECHARKSQKRSRQGSGTLRHPRGIFCNLLLFFGLSASARGRAMEVTKPLRLNLGLPEWLTKPLVEQGPLRQVIQTLSPLFLPVEVPAMWFWLKLPARARYMILMPLWHIWLVLHKILPAWLVQRGMADELSIEAHALGNVLYWVRIVPVNLRRMRFSLAQLDSSCPPSTSFVREVVSLPHQGVSGTYIHVPYGEKKENPKVMYWIFGGAFVGGTVQSSMGIAEQYALRVGCDIFMLDMRLYPEFGIEDSFVDACRGYEWLLTRASPENILVYGLSSGGGIALRFLQLTAAGGDQKSEKRFFQNAAPKRQPAGCVLCGAWVRYTTPAKSMKEYPVIDWVAASDDHLDMTMYFAIMLDALNYNTCLLPAILHCGGTFGADIATEVVTQRVYEYIYPKLGDMCGGDEHRERVSPVYNDMTGLCPLYVSVSDHEVCLDENKELIDKAGLCVNTVKVQAARAPLAGEHSHSRRTCTSRSSRTSMKWFWWAISG